MDQSSVFSILLQSASSTTAILAVLGVVSVLLMVAVLASKISAKILPNPKETKVSDFLPFSHLDKDGATIFLKNGERVRVFEIKGTDTIMIQDTERDALAMDRKRWIDSLSELDVIARVITVRERIPLSEEDSHKDSPLLHQIAEKWLASLSRVYRNKHYIVLSVADRQNALKDLNAACTALTTILAVYEPVMISEKTPEKHSDKSPFWLFSKIISPLNTPYPIVSNAQDYVLNSLLTADYIHFTKDEGIIKFISGDVEKLAICIGIRRPGDFIDEQMVATIQAIDCELCITHNIKPIPLIKARYMLIHQRRMAYLTSFSENVLAQFNTALQWIDATDADAQTLNEYAMTVMLFGSSKEELDFGQDQVEKVCRTFGVTPVREGWAAQAVFFSQLPSYDVYPRTYLYLSRVIACSVCVDKATEGRQKSDWGNVPLSWFKTVIGTPYAFQFHVSEEPYAVAHTALIGPTGQGKTTFFSFMAGQALRIPDLNTYFFDRNNGAKIFALMQGAPYLSFAGEEGGVSMNPFSVKGTAENRAFLRTWIQAITGGTDAVSEQEIARAVTTAFDYLPFNQRNLKNLYKSCFAPNGYMRKELFRWINDEQYGRIFNAEVDNLELNNRYMGFDFTHIFDDPVLAPAVISYIMHRIHTLAAAKGTPTMIMIDETAPMLEHPMFKENFIVGLREGRKKRQAFLCAFQQPKFLDEHGLGDVIRGQCQTVIFFRNPQASPADYASWNLSPRELSFIMGKEFTNHKYAILVSRPAIKESVILDIDLSGLGPYLKIYSSGNKDVLLAEQLAKQIPDSDALVQAYLSRVG